MTTRDPEASRQSMERHAFLLIDESEGTARQLAAQLEQEYADPVVQRVATHDELESALASSWSAIVVGDHSHLTLAETLRVVQARMPFTPTVVLTEKPAVDRAVAAIKLGAHDFLGKDQLSLLPRAIERARGEVAARVEAARSDARFRATFEQSAVGVVHGSARATILRTNRHFAEMLGYTPEELVGRSFESLTFPGDAYYGAKEMTRLLSSTPETICFEKRYCHRTGRPVWISATLVPANDPLAPEPYVIGVVQDISARKEAEEQLRSSEARYRELMEQASEAILITDAEHRYHDANTRACELTGYTREQLLNLTIEELLVTGDVPIRLHEVERGKTLTTLRQLRRADGTLIDVELSSTLLSNGRYQAIVGDISARKKAEELLRQNEERFRLIAGVANDAIYDWDFVTDNFWVNERYQEMFGFVEEPGTARVEWWRLHVHPEDRDRVVDKMLADVQSPEISVDEYRFVRDDGSIISLHERRLTLHDSSGKPLRVIGTVIDQTKRIRAEQQLRASEERFRLVADATNDAIFDWNTRQRTIWVNDRMRALFGDAPEGIDAHLEWWMDRMHPDDLNRTVGHRLNGLFGDGATEPIEYRMTREHDGAVVPVLERTFVVRSSNGTTVRVVGTITDLTEIKAVRSALSRSEEKFQRLYESSTVGITFWREDGTIVDANSTFLSIVGYDRQALDARELNWRALTSPGSRREFDIANEELVARGSVHSFRKRYVRRDGTEVPVLVTASLLQGDTYDGVSVVLDMTQQERATDALRANEERLRLLIENSHDIITILQPDGIVSYVSASVERILGFKPSELIGRNTFDWMHPDDAARVRDVLTKAIVAGMETAETEYRYRARDGSWRWLESIGRNLMTERGIAGIVVNSRDVTERRLWQRRLEQAERLTSLGRLAATVAHEFNNVLMGIQPFAEVLRRKLSDDPRVASATQHIETSVKRGRRITQEILRFTQAAEPTLSPVPLRAWLEEVESELRAHLTTTTRLSIDLPDERVAMVADRLQLAQALTNLVLNARDAMPDGGVIRIGTDGTLPGGSVEIADIINPREFVHIWVADEGGGIPTGIQQRLFEPLFTTKRGGTGLGLPIVHQIVTRHGGHVLMESELGRGATFHLLIPRASEDAAHEQQQDARHAAGLKRGGSRVLLIEDEVAVAEGLEALLTFEGFVVKTVYHGLDAEAAIDAFQPDIVVLDVGLPDINGVELYERLAAKHQTLPVVFSTGHSDLVELGATPENVRLLRKPYTSDSLLDVLDDLLGTKD